MVEWLYVGIAIVAVIAVGWSLLRKKKIVIIDDDNKLVESEKVEAEVVEPEDPNKKVEL